MPTAILSSNALLQSGREFPPYCKYVSLLVVFPLAFVAFFTAWLFSQFQGETQEYLNLKKKKKKNERKEENMHKDSLICLIILIWAMIWSQQKGPWDELSDCLQLWFTSCVPCAHKPPAAAGGSAGCDPHTAPTWRHTALLSSSAFCCVPSQRLQVLLSVGTAPNWKHFCKLFLSQEFHFQTKSQAQPCCWIYSTALDFGTEK